MDYPKVIIKKKREASIKRMHPWVFSGAIHKIILKEDSPELEDGDIIDVCDYYENPLATGHFSNGSIAVRILSFKQCKIDASFWDESIKQAYQLRKSLNLIDNPSINAYRLVHAAGDGLPGLIIDIYGEVAILQAHSLGMAKSLKDITASIKKVYGNQIKAIYSKSEKSLIGKGEKLTIKDGFLFGEQTSPQIAVENSLKFEVDWINGQKTGFFIDQRENRSLLKRYSKGKKVLNTFCYSGGFSVYAMEAGAEQVHSVDSSQSAIELANKNVALNFDDNTQHKSFVKDTLKFLGETTEQYDVIILDPPAYAKSKNSMHKAVQAYKRINEKALGIISNGGILFTFSCSQVISRKLFEDTVTAAAISAGRTISILHHLSQPADHPVSIFHPEGEYLKGLVLYIHK